MKNTKMPTKKKHINVSKMSLKGSRSKRTTLNQFVIKKSILIKKSKLNFNKNILKKTIFQTSAPQFENDFFREQLIKLTKKLFYRRKRTLKFGVELFNKNFSRRIRKKNNYINLTQKFKQKDLSRKIKTFALQASLTLIEKKKKIKYFRPFALNFFSLGNHLHTNITKFIRKRFSFCVLLKKKELSNIEYVIRAFI